MESINRNISINLKMIRKEKGLTLEDLSSISGVSKSMLGEIERGSTNPTILVLYLQFFPLNLQFLVRFSFPFLGLLL